MEKLLIFLLTIVFFCSTKLNAQKYAIFKLFDFQEKEIKIDSFLVTVKGKGFLFKSGDSLNIEFSPKEKFTEVIFDSFFDDKYLSAFVNIKCDKYKIYHVYMMTYEEAQNRKFKLDKYGTYKKRSYAYDLKNKKKLCLFSRWFIKVEF